jgi:hypothetical protein
MSIKTWKKEFYPTPANKVSERFALQHSLRKWLGLRKSALKRHNLYIHRGELYANESHALGDAKFVADSSTCSLCVRYITYLSTSRAASFACGNCPLYLSRGEVPCYGSFTVGKEETSPYMSLVEKDDPEPMIKALQKAVRFVKKGKAKAKGTKKGNKA